MTRKADFAHGRRIPLLFDPREIGESLREVAVDVVQIEAENILSRWYHSTHDADLFIWTDEKSNLIKHQVTFCGQVVEWNVFDGIKTGLIVEHEHTEPHVEGSEIIHFDENPQKTAVLQALSVLEHVGQVGGELRDAMMGNLQGRASSALIRREDLPQRLRLEMARNERPGFWRRLKSWFSGNSGSGGSGGSGGLTGSGR